MPTARKRATDAPSTHLLGTHCMGEVSSRSCDCRAQAPRAPSHESRAGKLHCPYRPAKVPRRETKGLSIPSKATLGRQPPATGSSELTSPIAASGTNKLARVLRQALIGSNGGRCHPPVKAGHALSTGTAIHHKIYRFDGLDCPCDRQLHRRIRHCPRSVELVYSSIGSLLTSFLAFGRLVAFEIML